ncbi:Hypothetical protein R9X50_00168400 [Acrodontium crateriforme]|uniref:AB hydrolase-1 domain-containing protein n=1 Tax=Acrodontium crateriforme TaxID=150365 RepID=A0AAQ3LZR7_9PEZI|nr:Hypothetical protein R9X50_00168400 [Acrodontium crateriforme]
MADASLKTLHPFLNEVDTKVSSGGTIRSYSHDTRSGPVLLLLHGYPQSSYMWRHIVPWLKDYSLFIPELPGYGISSLPPKPDKRTVGNLILEAFRSVFPSRDVIWVGHDRGARVGHRLLVDNDASHRIITAILIDIVPTTQQWRAFANPLASIAYYHWPFLALPTAPQLIEAMGGYEYCKNSLDRARGANEVGAAKFKENDAVDHYSHLFSLPETIAGSCADYASAAGDEVKEQESDQKEGKKIQTSTLVLYSASNLGRMHDVDAVWKEWVQDGTELRTVGIKEFGHYLPEETPEQVAEFVLDWVEKHSSKQAKI